MTDYYNSLKSNLEKRIEKNPKSKLTEQEKKQLGEIYKSEIFGNRSTGNIRSVSKALENLKKNYEEVSKKQKNYKDYDKEILKEKTTARRAPSKVIVHKLDSDSLNPSYPPANRNKN